MKMKQTFAAIMVTFCSLLGAGCNKSEPGGVPGTDSSFTLSPGSETLKPKESKSVKIGINRKDAFKEAVIFSVTDVPKGLKADLNSKSADAATKEITLIVSADDNAQPGDYVVKLTAKPEKTGKDTLTDVKIKVEKP
jgi:hypothetical protein